MELMVMTIGQQLDNLISTQSVRQSVNSNKRSNDFYFQLNIQNKRFSDSHSIETLPSISSAQCTVQTFPKTQMFKLKINMFTLISSSEYYVHCSRHSINVFAKRFRTIHCYLNTHSTFLHMGSAQYRFGNTWLY